MTEPSDALRKQLASDAGPHATPDQEQAAEKRRAAVGVAKRTAPTGRHASRKQQDG